MPEGELASLHSLWGRTKLRHMPGFAPGWNDREPPHPGFYNPPHGNRGDSPRPQFWNGGVTAKTVPLGRP
jgi:hypothetical protein